MQEFEEHLRGTDSSLNSYDFDIFWTIKTEVWDCTEVRFLVHNESKANASVYQSRSEYREKYRLSIVFNVLSIDNTSR